MTKKMVLVIGDPIVDRYTEVEPTKVSPEAPVLVTKFLSETMVLGGAANVAANVAAQGVSAGLIGVVGQDADAKWLEDALHQKGIWSALLHHGSFKTTIKTRIIANGQQILRVDDERYPDLSLSPPPSYSSDTVLSVQSCIEEMKVVVCSDYGKGTLTSDVVASAIARSAERKIPVLVDPKGVDWSRYHYATAITPNLLEAWRYMASERGVNVPDEVPKESETDRIAQIAERIHRRTGIEHVLITLGHAGVHWYQPSLGHRRFDSLKQHVYDVTGAGDTFIGVLASSLAEGYAMPSAIERANIAAGVSVSRPGTTTVTRDELAEAMYSLPTATSRIKANKVVLMETAAEASRSAKQAGRRVVFTNGCFDLFHGGHLRLLEYAASQGDLLIVGLDSDDSVKLLKGPGRPVRAFEDRSRLLQALSEVHLIVCFSSQLSSRYPSLKQLLLAIRPDVLIKGTEAGPIYGADLVAGWGGRVLTLCKSTPHSTSAEIADIKKRC